jgi:hypothetical protein
MGECLDAPCREEWVRQRRSSVVRVKPG